MPGIIAVTCGASATKRVSFRLTSAGAICALPPIDTLGIMAVLFISLAKGEFEAG